MPRVSSRSPNRAGQVRRRKVVPPSPSSDGSASPSPLLSSPLLSSPPLSSPLLPAPLLSSEHSNSANANAHNSHSHSHTHAGTGATLLVNESGSKRWRDWSVRWASGLVMIGGFVSYLYFTRQVGIVAFVFAIQSLIYRELVSIAIKHSKETAMPGFRLLYYHWFLVAAFFMYTRTVGEYLLPLVVERGESASIVSHVLQWLLTRHVVITAALYFVGLIAFVLSLKRQQHFRYQFGQFAYCHLAIVVVVVQSTYLVSNAFQGIVWFFLPVSLVVVNDSFAYIFGFLFGRTPLIALSPKKTVEGFVGGAAATIAWAIFICWVVQEVLMGDARDLMLCPMEKGPLIGGSPPSCTGNLDLLHNGIFHWHSVQETAIAPWLPTFLRSLQYNEFQLHAIIMAIFASMVAPFGGFFASGFKRALKIKDFGTVIPGHGGFTDRMDCQLVMGFFAYIYLHYIVGVDIGEVPQIFRRAVQLDGDDYGRLMSLMSCFLAQNATGVSQSGAYEQCLQMH